MNTPLPKLHALLAQQGYGSRRLIEGLIKEGRVKVDGQIAQVGQRVSGTEQIEIDGQPVALHAAQLRYFLVNKPVGVVSTTSDELGRPTVLSLIPPVAQRLYPVGRLDLASEGLLLLTNDGALTNRLTHPRYHASKTYRVTVQGLPSEKAIAHLERGVRLKEGYTNPAVIANLHEHDNQTTFDISINQGWNQQVRRMCERVGYPVLQLIRLNFGPFSLKMLEGKRWLELSREEVQRLTQSN